MFIKNNASNGFKFKLDSGIFEVDYLSHFADTGRIRTSNVSEISDKLLKELKKDKSAKRMLDSGVLEILEDDPTAPAIMGKVKEQSAEIERLNKELAQAESMLGKDYKQAETRHKAELKEKDDELERLKALLDAYESGDKKPEEADSNNEDADSDNEEADSEDEEVTL